MGIRPLHNNVLVKRIEQDSKTAGGIIIPDSAQEKPMEGIIVSVGNGSKDENGNIIPLDVKVGEKVLFTKWGGTEIKTSIDGKQTELLVMKESDILAVVDA